MSLIKIEKRERLITSALIIGFGSVALITSLLLAEPKMDTQDVSHLINPDKSAYCEVSKGYYFWHCARDTRPEGMPLEEALWILRQYNSHLEPGKLREGDLINLPLNFKRRSK